MSSLSDQVERTPNGKIRQTKTNYDLFIEAYLRYPGNSTKVASEMGCTWKAARKVWDEGWTHQVGSAANGEPQIRVPTEWAPPIKLKLAEYQALARAKLERLRREQEEQDRVDRRSLREAAERAKQDIVESKALQGRAVKQARGNAIALMGLTGNLLYGATILSRRVREQLDRESMPLGKAIALLRSIAVIVRESSEAAKIADEMERAALGDPDMIQEVSTQAMTEDDALQTLRDGWRALQRAGLTSKNKVIDVDAEAQDDVDEKEDVA